MYQSQYDPVNTQVYQSVYGCNYGAYQSVVHQQVYVFVKQYTDFKWTTTNMQYQHGTQVKWVCLSGSLPITYKTKKYTIPINIILPSGYPTTAPKVYLAYKLDKDSAKDNPLIVNESEVMINYLHKWMPNSPSYTLGGLCYNLSKSFEMYPPLGESPKSEGVLSSLSSATSSMINSVKTSVSKATNGKVFKEDNTKTKGAPTQETSSVTKAAASNIKTPEMEQREDLIAKVTQKLISMKEIANSLPIKDDANPCGTLLTGARAQLEENASNAKKQILVIEGEIQEMNERCSDMKEFISKNENTEVTKVR